MYLKAMDGYVVPEGIDTSYQAQSTMEASSRKQNFSKAWTVGDKLSVFFPILWIPYYQNGEIVKEQVIERGKPVFNEDGTPKLKEKGIWTIIVHQQWGHEVSDMKAMNLGTSFIPTLTEVLNGYPIKYRRDEKGAILHDDFGEPMYDRIDGDLTYQFSNIAPLFLRGAKQKEMTKVTNGKYDSEEFRRQAIKDIEDKYDNLKPIIGRLSLMVNTEVLVVKTNKYDAPMIPTEGGLTSYIYRLRKDRLAELNKLLNDPKFSPKDMTQTWFEVQMTFNGNSNDRAGRASAGRQAHPVGLVEDFTTKARFPEEWDTIQEAVNRLPRTSVAIGQHMWGTDRIPESKIKSALSYYIMQNADNLDAITAEKDMDMVTRNAYYLVKFAATDHLESVALKNAIKTSYEEYMIEHPNAEVVLKPTKDQAPEPSEDDPVPTAADLLGIAGDFSLAGDEETL